MATTGIVNATNIAIYIGTDKICDATSAELSFNTDIMDATSKDSQGWEEGMPGKKSWEMNGDAFFSFDADYGYSDLFGSMTSGVSLSLVFQTGVTGDQKYTGSGYMTSLVASGGVEENEKYTFSFKGTGVITEATV